ncbi:MAG: PaaI family thioesterase [Candidatus Obscuribacterales bacterium]|nr:PaaI family thioesterase [Steroidobacteraceae bacterium]
MLNVPIDFQPHFRKSPVTNPWEPLFSRQRDGGVDILFAVGEAHCNSRGFLHGGVLASLCDNAMGLSLAISLADKSPHIVTINLSVDYMDSAKIGDAILIEPRVVRTGGSIGFCDALVTADGVLIARANASFRIKFKKLNA